MYYVIDLWAQLPKGTYGPKSTLQLTKNIIFGTNWSSKEFNGSKAITATQGEKANWVRKAMTAKLWKRSVDLF